MIVRPRTAMVLAAGLGTRMRPLTEHTAKPLLTLGGRSLLDHALDRLEAAGVEVVVVNTHWQGARVAAALAARRASGRGPHTVEQPEDALLDTGGAVAAALPRLGDGPFFVLNGDAFWLDGPVSTLDRLSAAFDPAVNDAVLLLQRSFMVHAEIGGGDFALDAWGVPRRRREHEIVPYIYAGVQITSAAMFADAPAGAFSSNLWWDRAIAARRLHALVHDGLWFHLSTPSDLAEAGQILRLGLPSELR